MTKKKKRSDGHIQTELFTRLQYNLTDKTNGSDPTRREEY